ncbi:hypothetical protein [Streptomyces ochraceiscleroticus]|uniref:hypothetical protein n=1 Tax=Streptomyces ochraceiscleroticus TaxID=47761 RepID=UPI0004C5F676|nr:hypothetical protein [Streptomyces ochraceiscleroticus]
MGGYPRVARLDRCLCGGPVRDDAARRPAPVELLERAGWDVRLESGGCCGRTVGSDRLFPAIAAEPAETVLVASGISCRQQIFHGTERTAWYPVELIRDALDVTGR